MLQRRLWLLVPALALLGTLIAMAPPAARESSHIQAVWEYETMSPNKPNDLRENLNETGADGWEFVGTVVTERQGTVLVFKRVAGTKLARRE